MIVERRRKAKQVIATKSSAHALDFLLPTVTPTHEFSYAFI